MIKISIIVVLSLIAFISVLLNILVYRGKLPSLIKHQNKIQLSSLIIIVLQILSVFILSFNPILFEDRNKSLDANKIFEEVEKRIKSEYPDKVYNPDKPKSEIKQEFTKQSAIDSVKEMFTEIKGSDDKDKLKERLSKLDSDDNAYKDNTYFPQNVLAKIYLPDTMSNDNVYQNTATALLALAALLEENTGSIEVKILDMASLVIDEKTNTVFVPLDIFVGRFTGITLQMVFIDGEWKLLPHSLMITAQNNILQQKQAELKEKGENNN